MNNAYGIILELQRLRQEGNLSERFNKAITDAIVELKFREIVEPVDDGGTYVCPICYDKLDALANYCGNCGQAVE